MKVEYFFKCACGQESENLGLLYRRLSPSQRWVCSNCVEKVKQSMIISKEQPLKNGFLLTVADF